MSNLLELAERARKAGKEGVGSLTSQDGDRELYQRAEAALAKSVAKRKEVFSKLFEKRKTGPSRGAQGVTEASREFTQGFSQEIQNTILGASGVSSGNGDRVGLSDLGSKEMVIANCKISGNIYRLCVKIDPNYQDQKWGDNMKITARKGG